MVNDSWGDFKVLSLESFFFQGPTLVRAPPISPLSKLGMGARLLLRYWVSFAPSPLSVSLDFALPVELLSKPLVVSDSIGS